MTESKIPSKENFSEWYNELLKAAEIVDVRYPVKGMSVWYPLGFALRRNVYNLMRKLLDVDHLETQFPLLIPETEFMKEAEHIKGFEEEVYWVTNGGTTPLDVKLALRPTSETAIYPMFKLWIRSHADLPLKIYQIVNTFRYETKHTRPLIRLREISSFKEAHTVHSTWDEAAEQVETALKIYAEFYKQLAIPFLFIKRPSWDKFPGSDYSIALDTIMPSGRTLQIGTAHHLGTNFATTYDITYENQDGEQEYVNQTCYGVSERCIAALISVHGDDNGLILPWSVAPTQVIIVPILFKDKEKTLQVCQEIQNKLLDAGIRVKVDDSDERPGAKFYKWELRGVPLRIEIGPRDIQNGVAILARRDGEKNSVPMNELVETILKEAEDLYQSIYNKAQNFMNERVKDCSTVEEAKKQIEMGIARVGWCGSEDCGYQLEEQVDASVLGEPWNSKTSFHGRCLVCGAETENCALMSRQY